MTPRRVEPDAVTAAWIHPHHVSYSWHTSLCNLLAGDLLGPGRLLRGGFVAVNCTTGGLPEARNQAVTAFLDDRPAPWLWWTDTDMGFPADALERLLAVADPDERPVVAGLCFAAKQLGPDGAGGFHVAPVPTIYDWHTNPDGASGFVPRFDYERDALNRCAGTGSAFILIHRHVLEKMRGDVGDNWYTRAHHGNLYLSEDLAFCMRLAALEVPLYVHTGVRTTHHKTVWLAESDFDLQIPRPVEEQAHAAGT